MTLKAVFFDLDDTLLDMTGTHPERAERVYLRLKGEHPQLELASFLQRCLATNPATGWPFGVVPILEELGIRETALGREALDLWFYQGCFDLVRCLPGAEAVIRSLSRSYALGVVTNGREDRQSSK